MPRPTRHRILVPGPRPRAWVELTAIALMFGAYKLGRLVAAEHVGEAFSNAYVIWDLERILRLPDELSLQSLMLRSTAAVKSANVYYAVVHFPATAAFLLWLYLRHPADYLWLRRTLALLTAAGLLVHLAIPVAPPRMLGQLGFVDTADVYGPAVYGPPGPDSLAAQYAAMPSLHVGWAIVVAIGVLATTRSRWRWLILAHPVITALVVAATANHFWLDGLVAAGLLAAALVVVRAVTHPAEENRFPDFVPVLPVATAPPPAARSPATRSPATQAPTAPVRTARVPTARVPTAPAPTALVPTALVPTALVPTARVPTAPAPTAPAPTAPVPTAPVPTALVPTAPVSTAPPVRRPDEGGSGPGAPVPDVAAPVAAFPDRLPPPVRLRPAGPGPATSGPGPEDLADVAGDRRDG